MPAIPMTLRNIYNYLREINYDHELVARKHTIDGISIRSYELINMHKTDFDPLLNRILKDITHGEVLYDIGANVGTFTLAVATTHTSATIHSFEPNPTTSNWLQTNIRANDLTERLTVHQCGISDIDDTLTFYSIGAHRKNSFERTDSVETATAVDEIPVPVVTLDSLSTELSPPDRIKVDVEGHGDAVLRGGRDILRTHSPVVYIEPHGNDSAIADLLETVGYNIERKSTYWVARPR